MENPHKIVQNTTYLTLAFIFQKILSFIYFTLIARLVGVEGTGVYVFALSYTTVFSVFIDLGLSSVLTRELAKDKEHASKYLANVLAVKMILALLIALSVIVSINIFNKPPLTRLMVYLAAIIMVLDSFTLSFWAVFRAVQNFFYEATSVIITQTIIVAVGITGLLLNFPIYILIIALICGSFINFIYSLVLVIKKLQIKIKFEFDRDVLKFLFKIAIPFALAGIFTKFYSYLDQVLLSFLASDQALGWYSVPYKITFALQFIPAAFGAALFPAMSSYFVCNSDLLKKSFEKSTAYLIILALPISVGIGVLAREIILNIYGAKYEPSILSLQLLISGLVFIFVNFPVGSLLNACNKQVANTVILGVTMMINLILNLILIPRFSYFGASVSALASSIILCCLGIYLAGKIIKYDWRYLVKILLKSFLAALVMGVAVFYLKNIINYLVVIPIGALIYFIVLFLVKGLTILEVISLYHSVRQRKIV